VRVCVLALHLIPATVLLSPTRPSDK